MPWCKSPVASRVFLSRTVGVVLTASVLAVATAASARAQSVSASAYTYQYADVASTFSAFIPPGCLFGTGAGTNAASASTTCNVQAVPGGSGTVTGQALSSFDAATGTFKSSASLTANNFTLTQFVPAFDGSHDRTYPGTVRPDVVGVQTSVGLSDSYLLVASPGATPATISFLFDVDGVLQADPSTDGGHQIAQSFINICAVDCSSGSTNAYSGIAGFNLLDTGNPGFQHSASAPAGANAPTVSFAGSTGPNDVSGVLTFGGIPVSSGAPYDFAFIFGTQAAIYHSTVTFGHLPVGCDPGVDDNCDPADPVTFDGTTAADFANTVTFAGYQVLDANGNDITNSVKLEFESGLTTPPGITATPEPGTFLLVGGGLGMLGVGTRRRRNRGSSRPE